MTYGIKTDVRKIITLLGNTQVFNRSKKRVDNDSYFNGHNFYILALPEYEAIYHQNYDDTQVLYYRDANKIEPFIKLVKQTNLHILTKS